jgi:hypothetical protein
MAKQVSLPKAKRETFWRRRDLKELIGPDGLEIENAWSAWHRRRCELRQQHSLPLLGEFRQWLQATEHSVLPKSPI